MKHLKLLPLLLVMLVSCTEYADLPTDIYDTKAIEATDSLGTSGISITMNDSVVGEEPGNLVLNTEEWDEETSEVDL